MGLATHQSLSSSLSCSLAPHQIALIVFVFGISYLMVPLYRIFCAMTGIQGDVQVKNQTLLDEIEKKRAEGRVSVCRGYRLVSFCIGIQSRKCILKI